MLRRRDFLLASGAASLAGASAAPVRAITRGPKFHWFGYYDKLQFDPGSRYALGVANDFQHRLPTPEDTLELGMVDMEDGDRWIRLGESRSWSWHQTCMIQWLPGSSTEVIWNDREKDRFVAVICNVRSGARRTLPRPIYCVSPDARYALVNDFARSFSMRPETGYAGGVDPYAGELAPARSGIWRMDLKTGASELILSLADVARIPNTREDWTGAKHYFDHLLYAPDGKRFSFFQRWGMGVGKGFRTRMFTAGDRGQDVRLIDGSGASSHYNWRDPRTLVLWTDHPSHGRLWYLVDEPTAAFQPLDAEVMNRNGHISYLAGGRWIVNDTGPDRQRLQHQYLYDTRSRRKVELGGFHAPPEYTGVWRCDTTPRGSPDAKQVIFDSPHDGKGRQMYRIDIAQAMA